MNRSIKRIAVTGGAGNIGYSLLFRIANGDLLGKNQPIALHILEVPSAVKALEGIQMELQDCAFPLLKEIHIGSDPFVLFKDIDYALLVGAKPRGPGMERSDLLKDNGKIFIHQGKALNECAKKEVKVFVVGNPCNTNCLIAMHNAPRIPKSNFFAMTQLDQNRALFQIANKAHVPIEEVSRVTIWGNHSSTLVPDSTHALIKGRPLKEFIQDSTWLEKDFIEIVQKRGAAVIQARGSSSAASAANALIQCVQNVLEPTKQNDWYSVSICSDGNPYGIQEGLIFSFPCTTALNSSPEIVSNLTLDPFILSKIKMSEKELLEERDLVLVTEGLL